jgi:hypothetical protein
MICLKILNTNSFRTYLKNLIKMVMKKIVEKLKILYKIQ